MPGMMRLRVRAGGGVRAGIIVRWRDTVWAYIE
jgi:hypothetical protein